MNFENHRRSACISSSICTQYLNRFKRCPKNYCAYNILSQNYIIQTMMTQEMTHDHAAKNQTWILQYFVSCAYTHMPFYFQYHSCVCAVQWSMSVIKRLSIRQLGWQGTWDIFRRAYFWQWLQLLFMLTSLFTGFTIKTWGILTDLHVAIRAIDTVGH